MHCLHDCLQDPKNAFKAENVWYKKMFSILFYSKMSFTYSKRACKISCYDEHFYGRGDRAEIAAESLPCIIAISVYDETWICLTSLGQHKGLNSMRGTQGPNWRRAQLRSTSQPPPAYCCSPSLPGYELRHHPHPPSPYFNKPPHPPPTLTRLICIPVISYSHS